MAAHQATQVTTEGKQDFTMDVVVVGECLERSALTLAVDRSQTWK